MTSSITIANPCLDCVEEGISRNRGQACRRLVNLSRFASSRRTPGGFGAGLGFGNLDLLRKPVAQLLHNATQSVSLVAEFPKDLNRPITARLRHGRQF